MSDKDRAREIAQEFSSSMCAALEMAAWKDMQYSKVYRIWLRYGSSYDEPWMSSRIYHTREAAERDLPKGKSGDTEFYVKEEDLI